MKTRVVPSSELSTKSLRASDYVNKRCTHNDHLGMEPCQNEAVAPDGYCVEHGCCICGGVMLADTEDWRVYLCEEHWMKLRGELLEITAFQPTLEAMLNAAFEAGRRAVIGSPLESDDEVENGR